MREVTVKLYQYDELPTEQAKEKARDWFREAEREEFGQFGEIYEPAETAARLLGIEFERTEVKLLGGNTRSEPRIDWDLSYSQGSGASFRSTYRYAKGCARKIAKEFPEDDKLKRIAQGLQELQRKYGYKLEATTEPGRYTSSANMNTALTDQFYREWDPDKIADAESSLGKLMRSFADWIFDGIRSEYEYRLEDTQIVDGIQANEYEFRENGQRSNG